jgi:hypothetical protein
LYRKKKEEETDNFGTSKRINNGQDRGIGFENLSFPLLYRKGDEIRLYRASCERDSRTNLAIARGGMTIRFEKLATAKQIFDAIFP